MSASILLAAGAMKTPSGTHFAIKPQSPTGHLMALRHPNNEHRNTNAFLSPSLHNVPDTWVRHLRSKSLRFVDEFGDAKNHRLLMGITVQERKVVHQWADDVKAHAGTFTLAVYDDQVAIKRQQMVDEYYASLSEDEDWKDEEIKEYEDESSYDKLARSKSCSYEETKEYEDESSYDKLARSKARSQSCSSITTVSSTDFESIFDDGNSSGDETDLWDDMSNSGHGVYAHGAFSEDDEFDIPVVSPTRVRFSLDSSEDDSELEYDYSGASGPGGADLSWPIEDTEQSSAQGTVNKVLVEEEADEMIPSARDIELKYMEKARQERLYMAEDQLASAWYHWSGFGHANRCSWVVIESQTPRDVLKKAALKAPFPILQVITPEGKACDIIERPSILPRDHEQHVEQRNAAQTRLALKIKKLRANHETYTEYIRRLDAEEWWAEKREETRKEMKKLRKERREMAKTEMANSGL